MENARARIEIRKQRGIINIVQGGKRTCVPVELMITDIYHPGGRKDCTVQIPKLSCKAKQNQGA